MWESVQVETKYVCRSVWMPAGLSAHWCVTGPENRHKDLCESLGISVSQGVLVHLGEGAST